MINLEGKLAFVTGGSRGIGAAIALALAENGADVAFTYQNSEERAKNVTESIQRTGRRAFAIQADSADPKAIQRSVNEALDKLGGLDILVNSAAVGMNGTIADLDVEAYQKMMDINVRAPVLFAKAAIPYLKAGGRIISIGSGLGERVPFAGVTAYAMSKAAFTSSTRGLSRAEKLVVVLYYLEELTMKEIGLLLDLSESRVCQIHHRIVFRLKRQLEKLRDDLMG